MLSGRDFKARRSRDRGTVGVQGDIRYLAGNGYYLCPCKGWDKGKGGKKKTHASSL
ncbi:hypothetical protein NBRC116597_11280 [Phaeobacter sp. NW0010-22]